MKITKDRSLRTFTSLLISLLCVCLLFAAVGCNPPGPGIETDTEMEKGSEYASADKNTDTTASSDTSSDTDGIMTIADDPHPVDPRPGDASLYDGIMISMVYGTGRNPDAAMPNGFIQLYNGSGKTVSLKGASLYYRSGTSAFTQFVFPDDASVRTEGYYLVRAASPSGYDMSAAVMTVDHCDAEWDILIDNKEFELLLAPTGWVLSPSDDVLTIDNAVSVFVADAEYRPSVYAIDNLSKNKVAVRTALKEYSGYHTHNLTDMTTSDLLGLRPRYTGGVVCTEVRSRLNEVRFSFPAGVYDEPLLLEFHSPHGYSTYYTLDGSDPRTSTTRIPYTGAFLLEDTSDLPIGPTTLAWAGMHGGARPTVNSLPGACVVKAFATDGENSTPVYTNTYFIDDSITLNNVTILSLSIPLTEMIGPNGFYNNYMPTGNITATRPRGLAMMEVFDKQGTRVGNSNVELAVSGNGSSGWAMKSLRIYYKGSNNEEGGLESDLDYDLFDGAARDANGDAITSFSRLLIRNSGNDCANSYIRDAFMQSTAAGLNVDYMATATTLVFFNGEFWGVYNIRERYSPEYVESHYGVDKENVALIESDYSQVHTNAEAPYVVSSGVEGDADDFNELISFMRSHSMADQSNYEYVCSKLDIDSLIDSYVVRIFYSSDDWPNNNIKLWRNRDPNDPSGVDTKWHFTLLDLDMGMGWSTNENNNFFYKLGGGSVCGDLMAYMMQNKGFKDQFICRFYEVTKHYLTPERLNAMFDPVEEERNALMPLQVARWGNEGANIGTWNNAVRVIRSFITNRPSIALNQLYGQFGVRESDILNMMRKQITVSFDETRATVTLNGVLLEQNETIDIDKLPFDFTIHAKANDGYELRAIIWTPVKGEPVRMDATGNDMTVNFTANSSGTVSVVVRAVSSDPTAGEGGQLVAGPTYCFYLDKNGDLYAWGDNRFGVLGLNSAQPYVTTPTLVMQNVAKVATTTSTTYSGGETLFTTAIVTKSGELWTVGINNFGQLGRNGRTDDAVLRKADIDRHIVDVAVGDDHLLVVDEQHVAWGVGHNNYQQIGTGCGEYTSSFVKVAADVVSVSAGRRATRLIKTDGHLYGLGDNRWEKLVDRASGVLSSPTLMMNNVNFCASGEHQCVFVTNDGVLYYAGWRPFDSFQKGSGNDPTNVKVMDGVKEAYLNTDDMIILCKNGDVYGYGLNTGNCLGTSHTGGKPGLLASDAVSCAMGYNFSAILYRDGTIEVQGTNDYGQAGNGQVGGIVSHSEVIR